jgi:hypothetical protein
MTLVTWRNATFALAVICGYQRWQSCSHAAQGSPAIASGARGPSSPGDAPRSWTAPTRPPALEAPSVPARTFYGFKLPAVVARLAPQPGETMRAYRDRVLPVVELAIAPQRARVARTRDDFTLGAHERAELDGAVQEAATAIQARVMNAIASGELYPGTFKPMAGVTIARDLLDIVDRGNTRFQRSLTPDHRTELASHRFDFADYLLFTAPWEDALHVLD